MENKLLQDIKDEYARTRAIRPNGEPLWENWDTLVGCTKLELRDVDEIATRYAAKQCEEMRKDVVELRSKLVLAQDFIEGAIKSYQATGVHTELVSEDKKFQTEVAELLTKTQHYENQ